MDATRIADLTLEDLRGLVEVFVWNALQDFGFDPDEGLELKPEVKAQLRATLDKMSGKTADEVRRNLGLE